MILIGSISLILACFLFLSYAYQKYYNEVSIEKRRIKKKIVSLKKKIKALKKEEEIWRSKIEELEKDIAKKQEQIREMGEEESLLSKK